MSAQTMLAAIQGGAKRFYLKGEQGVWEPNGPLAYSRRNRQWLMRLKRVGKSVYAFVGSSNASLWEAVKEAGR
jgi:hypothetical protein